MNENTQKKIKNKIIGFELKTWSEIKNYEFNKLKSNVRDVTKLEQSILNNGFTSPFYVWSGKNYVIDGTGRWLALQNLEKAGAIIPDLPIILIEAKSRKEAKLIAMQVSSKHGNITQESLAEFTSLDFELEELGDLAESELALGELNFMLEKLGIVQGQDNQDIDFNNINSNADRDVKEKTQLVTCPHCNGKFNMQI